MTMVEKMAKAIYERRNGYGCKAWSHQPASHREPYLADARSAMQAQSTPTDAMRAAALNVGLPEPDEPPLYEKIWRAMITKALSEAEEEGKL